MKLSRKHRIQKLIKGYYTSEIQGDPFIKRLQCSVIGTGMLHPGNIELLHYAIGIMPPGGIVLEIGSYGGLSTNLITYLLKLNGRTESFVSCDAWIYQGFENGSNEALQTIDGRNDVLVTDYMAYIRRSFVESLLLLSRWNLPHAIDLTSDDFFEAWSAKSTLTDLFGRSLTLNDEISLCYLDGDYNEVQARRDFENVTLRLRRGGLILLDDSRSGSKNGRAKIIPEIKRNPHFEIVAKNPNVLVKKC